MELYNENCFDYFKRIKDGSVSLVLIDPPYNISRDTNFASSKETGRDVDRFRISMDFGEWDHEFEGLRDVIKESYRILRDGGTFICFYDLWKITILKKYLEENNFKQLRFIEWVKTNPVPINSNINYLSNAREIAIVGIKKGKGTFNSSYDNGIYNFPICHDKDRFHPTQKPLALIKELVLKHTKEGDLVCDCFSGSGTTALACSQTDRHFTGCELDKEYYEKSMLRLLENRSLGLYM